MTVSNRRWSAALGLFGATIAWMVLWYFAKVRGATELALGFGLVIGDLVALLALVVTLVLIRDAFVSGTPKTVGRLVFVGLVLIGLATIVGHLIYVG